MDLLLLEINPIAFHLGPIEVRWYGLLIVSGIILAYLVGGFSCRSITLGCSYFHNMCTYLLCNNALGLL